MNPPIVFLMALISTVAVSYLLPDSTLSSPLFDLSGVAMIAIGLWLNARGSGQFEQAGTPIRPGSRGGKLVTDGVFSMSRNPMYLGMVFILLGAGLSLGSFAALVVAPIFLEFIQRRFIAMEERILEHEFGSG